MLHAVRIFPDDHDALADRASGPGHSAGGPAAARAGGQHGVGGERRVREPGGLCHHPGALQFLRCDARNDNGIFGNRAAGVRGVRQLRRAADDWRAGHDVSARQHGELLCVFHRRPCNARELFHSRRCGAGGLDLLFAAGDFDSDARPDCSGSSAWFFSSRHRCWAR